MGRHDRKHGAKHKAAVVHAVEQQGMTAAQVAALAAAGELKAPGLRDRLPAFSIAESTVRNYCQQARRRQRRNGHDHREHEVALAVRDSAAPSVAEIEAPPEASPLLQRLAVEMEEDRKATEAAIAERPGEQCRCELLEPSASNFLTAIKPSPWVLHNGAPTCEACRLPITDWRTRLAGYPVLIKRIEDARAAEPYNGLRRRLTTPRPPGRRIPRLRAREV